MLESIRKQGASAFIYLIFGLLIAIFIVNMGNGSRSGNSGGCSGSSNTTISVDGSAVNHTSYLVNNYAMARGSSQQRRYMALESLIKRELLAREAEKRGIRASGDMIQDAIKAGWFFQAGQRYALGGQVFDDHTDANGDVTKTWDYKKFKNWVSHLNVSVTSYQDEQEREMQAALMAEILTGSVQVSTDEAFEEYVFEHNTTSYDTLTFSPSTYRTAMRLTEDDVARFLATHEDEVKARFKSDEALYNDKPAQLRLRQIFIAKLVAPKGPLALPDPKAPPEEAPKLDKDGKPIGMPIDEAKAKLEAVRTAAAADPKKFTAAAMELSTDDAAKAMAGAIGWHTAADAQFADKAVSDAVKSLKVGDMTPVIATDKGVYLVRAEEAREKKVTYDQAKLDIAETLARDVWSKEQAKRLAIAALAKAGTDGLEKAFEKDPQSPPPHPSRAKRREQQKMYEQYIRMQQQQQQQQEGANDDASTHEVDHLASWDADDTSGKGTGGGSATGSGSGSGSAAIPAAGSGSGSAAAGAPKAPPAPPAPPPADLVASTDKLPVFADVPAPKTVAWADQPNQKDEVPGIGKNAEAAKAVFFDLQPGELAKRLYQVPFAGDYVVVQVISRTAPNKDEFAKESAADISEIRGERAKHFLDTWLKTKCDDLQKDGKIIPSDDYIRETDGSGNPLTTTTYKPCMSFGGGGVGGPGGAGGGGGDSGGGGGDEE